MSAKILIYTSYKYLQNTGNKFYTKKMSLFYKKYRVNK